MQTMRGMRGSFIGGALVALLALTSTACGGGDTTNTGGSGGTGATGGTGGTGTGGTPGPSCEGQPDTLDLTGTWAAYGALTVSIVGQPGSLVSICPTDQQGIAYLTLFVTIGQSAADPAQIDTVDAVLCAVDLPAVTAVAGTCEPGSDGAVTTQITVPDALLDALPSLGATTVSGTLAGTTAGSDVAFDRFVVTAGSSQTGANLPKWDAESPGCDAANIGHTNVCEATCVNDCPSLRDDDNDSYPGITLGVCGRTEDDDSAGKPCNVDSPTDPGVTIQGRAFAALEVDPKFSGVAKSSCELAGTVDTNVTYSVVGADVTLSGAPISVAAALSALPSLLVKSDQSKLSLVRVDGKYASPDLKLDTSDPLAACKTVLEKRNEIF